MGLNDEENGIWTGSLRVSGGTETGAATLSSARATVSAAGKRGVRGVSSLTSANPALAASGKREHAGAALLASTSAILTAPGKLGRKGTASLAAAATTLAASGGIGPSRWARFEVTSDFPLVPADNGAITVLGYRLQFKARINPYSSLIITGSVNLVNFIASSGTAGKASIFTMAIMQWFVPPDNVAVMYIQLQCPLDVYPWNATRESYVVLTNDGHWHDYMIGVTTDGELPGIMITNEDMPAGVMDTSFLSGDDLSSFVAVLSSAAPVDLADVVHIPKGSGPIMELRGTYAFDETSGTTAYDSSGDNDISGVNADIWHGW